MGTQAAADGDPAAREKSAEWLLQLQKQRELKIESLREQRRLAPSREGIFIVQDASKPWSCVYSTIPSASSLHKPMKDVSRQRSVIAKLRDREMHSVVALPLQPSMHVEDAASQMACYVTDEQGNDTPTPMAADSELTLEGELVSQFAAEQTTMQSSSDQGVDMLQPAVVQEADAGSFAPITQEEPDFEKMMQELRDKRDELSRILVQQGNPIKVAKQGDTSDQENIPLYQAAKPSHVKLLKGDLYSKMTPAELDKEKARLQTEIAELEKRTLLMSA